MHLPLLAIHLAALEVLPHPPSNKTQLLTPLPTAHIHLRRGFVYVVSRTIWAREDASGIKESQLS